MNTEDISRIACPFCGADTGITTRTEQRQYTAPFGPTVAYSALDSECSTCSSEGDFTGQNDGAIERAIDESVRASVQRMLEKLADQGLSMAHIERTADLPARTLARWKSGEVSKPGVVLLRMLTTYSWLLDVAEGQYEPSFAQTRLVTAAAEVLHNVLAHQFPQVQVTTTTGPPVFTSARSGQAARRGPAPAESK